jgi:hypothetical protein
MESEEKDVEKIDIIDDEVKSVLGELLDVSKDMRKLVLEEIKKTRQIVKNFDANKEEYIEAIDDMAEFEKIQLEEQKKKYQETIERMKKIVNG